MKKKAILIGGGGLAAVAGAAFVMVSMSGVPKKETDWEPLRGTESYYTGEEKEFALADFLGNLKGSQSQRFVKLGLTVVYRLGPELADAGPLFAAKKAAIMDRLHMLFNGKSLEDIEGSERKETIKEEIRQQLQALLFPEKKGRIEAILYREFFVQ